MCIRDSPTTPSVPRPCHLSPPPHTEHRLDSLASPRPRHPTCAPSQHPSRSASARPFPAIIQVRLSAWAAMDPLIAATAHYLPAFVVVAAVGIWLTLPRGEKVGLAVQALLSLALVAVLILSLIHI